MVLDKARGIRATKWLWLAVREMLLIGWSEQSFRRVTSGAKEVPNAESVFAVPPPPDSREHLVTAS